MRAHRCRTLRAGLALAVLGHPIPISTILCIVSRKRPFCSRIKPFYIFCEKSLNFTAGESFALITKFRFTRRFYDGLLLKFGKISSPNPNHLIFKRFILIISVHL